MSRFAIRPHPQATLYQNEDPQSVLKTALSELSSGDFNVTESVRQLVRQTALVSLWFYLKFVAGFNGPYDKINDAFDLELCNFRQSDYCMAPKAKGGVFAPRGHHKSTTCTHGPAGWELLRDPSLTIILSHAIYETATTFLHSVQQTFSTNEFFAWLFPEYVLSRNDFNDQHLTVPNRPRSDLLPSISCLSVGGTAQGVHPDLFSCDDLVGDRDLNAERIASMDMYRKGNWFSLNRRALPKKPDGRTLIAATRYGEDDVYEPLFINMRSVHGFWPEDAPEKYEVRDENEWDIYYRLPIENGEIAHPDCIDENEIERMQKEDYWVWATQMENKPWQSGLTEFNQFEISTFEMTTQDNHWLIVLDPLGEETLSVGELDVIQAGDPAASDSYRTAKTSRSAQVVLAQDADEELYVLGIRADYVDAPTFIDWLFQTQKRYGEALRASFVEMQGPFKMLGGFIRDEERRRGKYLNLIGVPRTGDKDAIIRTTLTGPLEARRLHVEQSCYKLLMEEVRGFPQSRRKDILDALSLAVAQSQRPLSAAERVARARRTRRRAFAQSQNVCGY